VTPILPTSEAQIQDLLFRWLNGRGQRWVCPNTNIFGWEADLVAISEAGRAIEYEIKVSRSDFKADNKGHHKIRKHQNLQFRTPNCPNSFYYAVPAGLIKVEEVPEYAGLLTVCVHILKGEFQLASGRRTQEFPVVEIVKRAPLLHGNAIASAKLAYLQRGLMLRYRAKRGAA